MREDLVLRGMSLATIDTYVHCARKFAEHFGRSPCSMGAREVRAFLLHLTARGLHPASINVYGGALRFLYGVTLERPLELAGLPRVRVPMRVPVVLSGTEVQRLLAAMPRPNHRVAAMLAYGAGLRVSEVCRLRIDDIDAKRMVLRIPERQAWPRALRHAERTPAPRAARLLEGRTSLGPRLVSR
jgi:integrase